MDLFPQAAVLQEWIAPSIPTDSGSCQKTFCCMGSLQRAAVPARNSGVGSPQTVASGYVYLLQCGSPSCLGGIACFTMVCRGTSPGAFPLVLFQWTWCLQSCLPSVFLLSYTASMQQIVHFLKYLITEVPLELQMGSALASGEFILGSARKSCVQLKGHSCWLCLLIVEFEYICEKCGPKLKTGSLSTQRLSVFLLCFSLNFPSSCY